MYVFTLIFGVVLWAFMLAYYMRHPASSIFHPMTFMIFFQFIIFVLRPILAYWQNFQGIYIAYEFLPTMSTKITALLVADLAFFTFCMSSLHFGSLPLKIKMPNLNTLYTKKYSPSFLIAMVLIGPIGFLSLRANFGEQASGSTTMILDSATGNSINTTGNGYFQNLAISLATIVVVFIWINRFRLFSIIPFLGYIVLRGATGGRFPFIMATGSLLLFYLWEKRRRWFSSRIIWPAAAVIILFGIIGVDRGEGIRAILLQDKNQITGTRTSSERPLESMDYANMEFSEYIIQTVPAKSGTYDYFASNLILFTGPIPRSIWPDKPIGSPIQFFSLFDYGNPIGMTMSMGGWGWYELGWAGVIIWSAFSGAVYGWLYNTFVRSRQNIFQVSAYITFLPLSLLYFRDGSLPEIINISAFEIIPIIVWFLLYKLFFKNEDNSGTSKYRAS